MTGHRDNWLSTGDEVRARMRVLGDNMREQQHRFTKGVLYFQIPGTGSS